MRNSPSTKYGADALGRKTGGLVKFRVPPYTYHVLDDGFDYVDVVDRFEKGEIADSTLLYAYQSKREVHHLRDGGRDFIFKKVKVPESRLEVRINHFLLGPPFSRLMKRVHKAFLQGCDVMQNMYLVREKMRRGEYQEMLFLCEYLPGRNLEFAEASAYADEIVEVMDTLHRHGLTMIDTHARNFLITPNGLKAIDLATHYFPAYDIAKDVVNIRKNMGLTLPVRGIAQRLYVAAAGFHYGWRGFFRKLREKLK